MFISVRIQNIIVLVRDFCNQAFRRTTVCIVLDMAAVPGSIRVGVTAGKLTDQLGEIQTGHVAAKPCICAGDILHQRIELVRGSPDAQLAAF